MECQEERWGSRGRDTRAEAVQRDWMTSHNQCEAASSTWLEEPIGLVSRDLSEERVLEREHGVSL